MTDPQKTTEEKVGPFAGLTVLEIGQFIVVPFCAQFLADGGARVIKVEPPVGDSYRSMDPIAPMESRQFIIKNRGKESVALRLGHPDANDVLRQLVAMADVVLVNMRAETVRAHGLTYDEVREINPRVVYGSVTAFGNSGPEAGLPGMDVVVQARSGLLHALGAEKNGVLYHSEVQIADYSSSLLLLAGISSALFARERTGEGQEVDVSLLGGAITMQHNSFGHFHDHDQWREPFLEDVLAQAREEGWSSSRLDEERAEMRPDIRLTYCYRVFHTTDGSVALGAGSPSVQRRLWALLELDPELDTDTLGVRLEAALATESTRYWIQTLRGQGIPVAEVKHIDEMFDDPQVRDQDLVRTFEHPLAGTYDALGVPIKLSATPFDPRSTSPAFAEHTDRVLAELGYDTSQISGLAVRGGVVLDPYPPL